MGNIFFSESSYALLRKLSNNLDISSYGHIFADPFGEYKMWKDLTDCNHNKKSLKQHVFYSTANFSHFIRLT